MIISCDDGRKGTVARKINRDGLPDQLVIEFDDGSRLTTSEDHLVLQKDGSARLARKAIALSGVPVQAIELAHGEELVVPLAVEELRIDKRRVERGLVQVRTRVETHKQTVDDPLLHEEVTVERVPIDKEVVGPVPKAEQKNGVLVIPVLEEVLVVTKQLRLKEEIRVIRKETRVHKPQTFELRRELVDIDRVEHPARPAVQETRDVTEEQVATSSVIDGPVASAGTKLAIADSATTTPTSTSSKSKKSAAATTKKEPAAPKAKSAGKGSTPKKKGK